MTITATSTPTYRKTKGGEWVAFGPVAAFHYPSDGRTPKPVVSVRKKDGTTKTEEIKSLGKSFMVDGIECCYAYLRPSRRPSSGGGRMSREERDDYYGCGCPGANGIDMCLRCGHSPG